MGDILDTAIHVPPPDGPSAAPAGGAAPVSPHREAPRPPRVSPRDARALRQAMAPYAHPVLWKSLWQVVNTFVPLALCWALAYASLEVSYALTLALALICAGLIVRLTLLQHDCGHYAFFKSRWANEWLMRVISLVNLAPMGFWTRQHAYHHEKINSLDRGNRNIFAECLTVREFRALKPIDRAIFRMTRDPLVFFPILAPLTMVFAARFPITADKSWKAERRNVYSTDAAIIAAYGALGWAVGFRELALIHIPIVIVASGAGFWLDFLGHRSPAAKWVHDEDWELTSVALRGCAYFKLPKVLQWFSGSIGLHHVHHLNPRIPNYALQKCLDGTPALQAVPAYSLWDAVKSAWLVLWDEDRGRLVRFDEVRPAPVWSGAPRTQP